ncbi:MAG: hypothetical protein S4CHLAM6_14290 [Chlamydiae bacterium]|nr:hypothetical protein [Chlamydiota bacterium]
MQPCPCNAEKSYKNCCYLLHTKERKAQNPLELMKSRFSAYAMDLPDYIIETTHPNNPLYLNDKSKWKQSINESYSGVLFKKLEILEHTHNEDEGYVTFMATLEKLGQDISFQERSYFIFEHSNWYYLNGTLNTNK